VLIDQDDYSHFHEDQPPGILAFWSRDDGDTWSEVQETGIKGFEPDRMVEMPDGRLAVGSHMMGGEPFGYTELMSCSEDGGQTWYIESRIAHDGYHRFAEGALVFLDGGKRLACVIRDSLSAGYPSWLAFSGDMGQTWSEPQMAPFAIHRPYAKQLPDGRVLVTGRNVNGGLGTYAWCGDLESEIGYQIGGPRTDFRAQLTSEALVIENRPGTECRYCLLPPESRRSEVVIEAELQVEGPPGEPVAFMAVSRLGAVVSIASDGIGLGGGVDRWKSADMTSFKRVKLHYNRGLLRVRVDGETLLQLRVFREETPIGGAARSGPLAAYTHFGQVGSKGKSYWKDFRYVARNPHHADFSWSWRAQEGVWPDEYQRRRLIQIHPNDADQKPGPDHGYSSWLQLADGRIFLVTYSNCGDVPNTAHLVGVYLEPEDIA
jgi:hypothetical protein